MGCLSLTILHVGKPRLPFVPVGVEHYRKKLRPLADIVLEPVREEPLRKGTTPDRARTREHARISRKLDPGVYWLALDDGGRSMQSQDLADLLDRQMQAGRSRIGFLIGGPWGLAAETLGRAEMTLSLSPMTLSHEMALLVLLEQLYRALAIVRGLPYPK